MTREWLLAVDVCDVDDQSVADAKGGRGCLREKQRRLEVGPHQVVPVNLGNIAHGRRVERRRIIDEDIERAEVARRNLGQRLQLTDVQQIRFDNHDRVWSSLVQLLGDGLCSFRGAPVVKIDIRARSMQFAGDSSAYSACCPRDQRSFAAQGGGLVWVGGH